MGRVGRAWILISLVFAIEQVTHSLSLYFPVCKMTAVSVLDMLQGYNETILPQSWPLEVCADGFINHPY